MADQTTTRTFRDLKTLDTDFSAGIARRIEEMLIEERPGERIWRDGRKVEMRTILNRRVVIEVRAYDLDGDR